MNNISKRHQKRLVKKQKDIYINKLTSGSNLENINATSSRNCAPIEEDNANNDDNNIINDINNDDDNNIINDNHNDDTKTNNLKNKLGSWYLKSKCSRKDFEDLLKVLKSEGLDVPLSVKTFNFSREVQQINTIGSGSYMHLGIVRQLQKVFNEIKCLTSIKIDVNIDGIPIFKSSRSQLWPILIKTYNCPNIRVLPVGIFAGVTKPEILEKYLQYFVEEFKFLKENGFFINDQHFNIEINSVICDTPAKTYVCGIPGHTSSYGCNKCHQKANKINRVLTYQTECGPLLTDEDFKTRKYVEHHNSSCLHKNHL